MKLLKVECEDYGPVVEHNMPCCIYPHRHAVVFTNTGHFHPSWKAQEQGWMLIQVKNRIIRKIINKLFGELS